MAELQKERKGQQRKSGDLVGYSKGRGLVLRDKYTEGIESKQKEIVCWIFCLRKNGGREIR